ncbi:MAG TPA: ribonuclease E/G, partial [Terracidiphilus sp.]
MAKEICISSTPHETRLAILEDDQLAEIYYERENEYTLAGSIYNGRVTRVLPGMQSAFVDIGLERDAFLYVTDFMELEDDEETDEIEKAAASGANQPPREVRHAAPEGRNGRSGQKPESKPEPKAEPKQEPRPYAEKPRGFTVEELPVNEAASLPASGSISFSDSADTLESDSGEAGAKRWRGRRRRRGGRGGSAHEEQQPQTAHTTESQIEEIEESEQEIAPQIQAGAGDRLPQHRRESADAAPHFERIPASTAVPFVMPGESLSKYGGAPAEGAAQPGTQPSVPVRPASSFKPATLIESPLQWDGSGLLPGESLSRHRNRPSEPAMQIESKTQPAVSDKTGFAVEEQEFNDEATEAEPMAEEEPESIPEILEEELVSKWTKAALADEQLADEEPIEGDEFEETSETVSEPNQTEVTVAETDASENIEPNADASHNLDPLPPTGFRLFGFGKKAEEAPKAPAKPVSSYAPGKGLVVEETIEEEEFDAPRHAHRAKGGDHDSDDLEEVTLPKHLRTGDLGEMLQEAHLDHRIQLNFDGEPDDEDEDEPAAGGQPASGAQGQQRRDRNLRGRHGRTGQAAPQQGNRGRGPTRRSSQLSDLPIISDLLKPGQEILVQIAKEPIAKKGARITSHIALPGRFLVFMPTVSHIGVSRKIESDAERQRLKRILVHERGEASGGFIVRTAAEGASEEELRSDLRMLLNTWAEIKKRSDESKSPQLILHDIGLIERILRDQISSNFSSIWVDSQENYERVVKFLNRFSPSLVRRVKLYTKE